MMPTCGTCRHKGNYVYECKCGCGMSLYACHTYMKDDRRLVADTDKACQAYEPNEESDDDH